MAGREWYDCQPCGIRYSDIMHDNCPECGNPDTTPTAPDTVIKLARLNDQPPGRITIDFFIDE